MSAVMQEAPRRNVIRRVQSGVYAVDKAGQAVGLITEDGRCWRLTTKSWVRRYERWADLREDAMAL